MPLTMLTLYFGKLRSRFESRITEWHLTTVMILGSIVVLTSDLFELPTYDVTRLIVDQGVIGIVMLLVGLSRLVVLLAGDAITRGSPHLRSGLASASALIWSLFLMGFLAFDTMLLVGAFLVGAIVFELVSHFRAATDAALEDQLHRAARDDSGRST